MKTITRTKKKEKTKLTSFFKVFTEKSTAPIKNDKYDSPLVSSTFVSAELGHIPRNYDELAEHKSEKLHTCLNRFIADGVTFKVSADDFQVFDEDEKLKISDKEFLQINCQDILCELQQLLLVKHLFSHSPEQFEDFTFEVIEREAIMTENIKPSFEIYVAALRQTTRFWLKELLTNG